MNEISGEGINPIEGNNYSFITGRIYLSIRDRDSYIKRALLFREVDIITDTNAIIYGVKLSDSIMNDVRFPITGKVGDLGSKLGCESHPITKRYYATSIFSSSDEVGSTIKENTFRFRKFNEKTLVDVVGSGDDGSFDINVNSGDKPGNSSFRFNNLNKDFVYELYVQGFLNLVSEKEINLTANQTLNVKIQDIKNKKDVNLKMDVNGFTYSDTKGTELNVDNKGKFSIKNSSYSLKDLFSDLISECSNITTTTAIGVQPVLNKVQFETLKQKITTLLK